MGKEKKKKKLVEVKTCLTYGKAAPTGFWHPIKNVKAALCTQLVKIFGLKMKLQAVANRKNNGLRLRATSFCLPLYHQSPLRQTNLKRE
jgi:hypothetical protein